MRILLVLLLVSATCLANSVLREQVRSLVGKKLSSSLAIVAKINEVDEQGRNALHYAAMLGDLPLVEFFIDHGANTQTVDNDGLVPLRYAERIAEQSKSVAHMKVTSLLLEKTRGVNKGDEKGWLPIVWSIMARDIPRIKELLAKGADVFEGRLAVYKPRHLAGRHNAVEMAEFLGDNQIIEILAQYAPDQYFPIAVGNGYRRFSQAMLDRNVDVNVRDRKGFSAAMRAARAGRIADLQRLMTNGVQLDGDVLLQAIHSGNPKLVKMVIDQTDSHSFSHDLLGGLVFGELNILTFTRLLDRSKLSKGGRRIYRMFNDLLAEEVAPLITTLLNEAPQLLQESKYPANASLLALVAEKGGLGQEWEKKLFALNRLNIADRGIVAYQELLRFLLMANKNKNDDLAQLAIEQSVAAGIDKEKLINHARLLAKVDQHYLRSRHYNLDTKAMLLAIKQNDLETIRGLIDHVGEFTDGDKEQFAVEIARHGDVELLEFFIDRQLIDLDCGNYCDGNSSILVHAAFSKNLPILEKVISLGGRVGIDSALRTIFKPIVVNRSATRAKQLEDQELAMIRSLIENGGDIHQQDEKIEHGGLTFIDEKNLLQLAIKSLQVPRVKFLLEQGVVVGNLDKALMVAEESANQPGIQQQENFIKIRQLLVDKGLVN